VVEGRKLEIERLQLILRDPAFTQEEKTLTRSQIACYQEMIAMTIPTSTDWLLQLNQLADWSKSHANSAHWGLSDPVSRDGGGGIPGVAQPS
jgi:hypothetical protein